MHTGRCEAFLIGGGWLGSFVYQRLHDLFIRVHFQIVEAPQRINLTRRNINKTRFWVAFSIFPVEFRCRTHIPIIIVILVFHLFIPAQRLRRMRHALEIGPRPCHGRWFSAARHDGWFAAARHDWWFSVTRKYLFLQSHLAIDVSDLFICFDKVFIVVKFRPQIDMWYLPLLHLDKLRIFRSIVKKSFEAPFVSLFFSLKRMLFRSVD